MQARFLLGPAGSGKTWRCLDEIGAELLRNPAGPPLILLAPRQATYQLERRLLSRPGLRGYTRLHILSFERFAAWLLERTTGRNRLLSEEGRLMVLRALVRTHQSSLKVFRRASQAAGFVDLLSRTLREFQQYGLAAGKLRTRLDDLKEHPSLADKLGDLALLLERYEAWLEDNQLQDAGTLPDLAVEALRRANPAPAIAGLWLDGMADLTRQEIELLAAVAPHCDSMTLGFCLEREPVDDVSWLSTWSVTSQAVRRCYARLEAAGDERPVVEVINRGDQPGRFDEAPALRHLEAHWTDPVPFTASDESAGVPEVVACSDPEAEAVYTARTIRRFVREGNRYRDCAVLLRSLESHHAVLRRVFRRYDIPFFLDRRESAAHHPLVELTRGALHLVLRQWRHTDWFRVLKTGFVHEDSEVIDRLENEALARGWDGAAWRRPFVDAGVSADFEALRESLTRPFLKLQQSLQGPLSASALRSAVLDLWSRLEVEDRLARFAAEDASGARRPTEAAHESVFNLLEDWLDDLERGFGGLEMSLADWTPILDAGLANLTVGVIPPALDQVLIGAIDRSRNPDLQLAVVMGFNEGRFPAPPAVRSLLTEAERDQLESLALPLGPNVRQQLGLERYLAYIACTRARRRLILTYANHDVHGIALNPSPFLGHLENLFPRLPRVQWPVANGSPEPAHPRELLPALLALSDDERAQLPLWKSAVFDPWRTFAARDRFHAGEARLDPELARQLHGDPFRSSVSRLEEFAACPFRFFVNSGLRARERKLFEIDSRERGTFQHEVLKEFQNLADANGERWRDLTPTEAENRVQTIGERLLRESADGRFDATPARRYNARLMLEHLKSFVRHTIGWMAGYRFDPVYAELDFGRENARLPGLVIPLDGGATLELAGSVDRVDLERNAREGDAALFVVIDYKSGDRTFDALMFRNGLQLQLPVYALAVRELLPRSGLVKVNELSPAGMFYVPLREKPHQVDSAADLRPDARPEKHRPFVHRGRFDGAHLEALDATGNGGQFKYRLKKDGTFYANDADPLTHDAFEGLLSDTRAQLSALGTRILSGEIKVDPYRHKSRTACDYCLFAGICRIDKWNHPYRALK